MRSYQRKAIVSGLATAASFALMGLGIHEIMKPGEPGPMQMLGVCGLLIVPVALVRFFKDVSVILDARDMRSGRTAIARWTLPPEEVARYREIDQRLAGRGEPSLDVLPAHAAAEGLDVIFSDAAVLVGDCHLELALNGNSRVRSVRVIASNPPIIEFGVVLREASKVYNAQTRSTIRVPSLWAVLRVPVSNQAALQGEKIAHHFQAMQENPDR